MGRLRETVDVLLEARGMKGAGIIGGASSTARAAVNAAMAGYRTGGPVRVPSALRVAEPSMADSGRIHSTADRVKVSIEQHEQHSAMLGDTLRDKKKHDQRIVALQKESTRLRDPHVRKAASTSGYRRINDDTLGIKKVNPQPTPAATTSELERRFSQTSQRRNSTTGNVEGTETSNAAAKATAEHEQSKKVTRPSTAPSKRPSSANTKTKASTVATLAQKSLTSKVTKAIHLNEGDIDDADAEVIALSANATSKGSGAMPHADSLMEDIVTGGRSNESATWPAKAKLQSVLESGPIEKENVHRPSSAKARTPKPRRNSTSNLLSSTGGFKKKAVKGTESFKEFSFTIRDAAGEKPMSIVTKKFIADYEAKLEAEEAALKYQFKAAPIAPATHDLGLYNRIMEKLEHRREALHAARSAKLASSFKPFTIVTGHCDEHAARQAARRAKFELEQKRELAESRKFHAIPVPSSTSNPDSMYFEILKREAERPGRVAANARALAATAALPPRMQLANENERRRKAEREAKRRAEELEDKKAHRFVPNPIPDFQSIYETFESSLVAARSAAGTTRVTPFGFDEPERIEQDLARREKWIREYELETSQSMALRRRSSAYAEGEDLTGDRANASRSRRNSSAAALGGTSHSATKKTEQSISASLSVNRAPPAAMTKSVQLKMLEVQRKLRENQIKEREEAEADEHFRSFIKESTHHLAPIIQDMERQRIKAPLAWQMDRTMASASDARKAFDKESRERSALNKARIEAAQSNRPLVMMRATLEREKELSHTAALQKVASTTARSNGTQNWRSVVENGVEGEQIFSTEERELLGYSHSLTASQSSAVQHIAVHGQ